ncbi:MAG: biotin transporter BioY [Oscillospiraceae bacterium]|nr:biotin transporter BioY [Oscillospiraceae bacterium]
MKHTNKIVITGLFSAILCIVAPITLPLPISPVPVSLAPLVIFISSFIMTPGACTMSVLVYLMLGTAGLPVFSGFTGGLGILAGPTGGYLAGYLAAAFISSFFNNKFSHSFIYITGMITGLSAMYLIGTIWFSFQQDTSFLSALAVCVLPYLFGDAVKITAALLIGLKLRTYISRNNYIKGA